MSLHGNGQEGVEDLFVTKELNTLLTGLYVLIDDHVVEPRNGRGRVPQLSDSELLTLAVAQMLLGFHGERRWVRHLHANRTGEPCSPTCPGSRAITSDSRTLSS